jgi:FAD/FMN-containing dehydrogenase
MNLLGVCPEVGTGGHTSYGGYGLLSRMSGLLMDRVVSADVVLANGTSITASNTSYPDLFWVCFGPTKSSFVSDIVDRP